MLPLPNFSILLYPFVGNPKGVMLSTYSMTTTVQAVGEALGPGQTFRASDCAISYLPLAHAFERGAQV